MAVTHGDGKAGQYAKRTAFEHSHRIYQSSMVAMLVAGVILAFLLAGIFQLRFDWMHWRVPFVGLVMLLGIGVNIGIRAGYSQFEKHTDQLARERITWLRGGQGEALVAWHLHELPDTWHVFHNVMIWDKCDLDHVLVGPGGLFCISTKANRGLYTVERDGRYLLNGEETDHVHVAQRLAMQLKDRLAGILGTVPWIQPVLIAPFAYIGFPTFQERAWVLHENNAYDIFEEQPVKLTMAEIERCAGAIQRIADHQKNGHK